MDPNVIAKIVCGTESFGSLYEFDSILEHMYDSITNITRELIWLIDQENSRFSLLGPFIGRSLLETCLTTLVGRIDPYRLLVLRHQQKNSDYNPSEKREISTKWTGDILASKTPAPADLLNPDKKYSDISRALLSDHYDILLWRPALIRILDTINSDSTMNWQSWISELQGIEDDRFIGTYRSKISTLYSKLSKGIHHEFVIPPERIYDRETVVSMLRDTVQYCCIIGGVANAICHLKRDLNIIQIFTLVNSVQSLEIN